MSDGSQGEYGQKSRPDSGRTEGNGKASPDTVLHPVDGQTLRRGRIL